MTDSPQPPPNPDAVTETAGEKLREILAGAEQSSAALKETAQAEAAEIKRAAQAEAQRLREEATGQLDAARQAAKGLEGRLAGLEREVRDAQGKIAEAARELHEELAAQVGPIVREVLDQVATRLGDAVAERARPKLDELGEQRDAVDAELDLATAGLAGDPAPPDPAAGASAAEQIGESVPGSDAPEPAGGSEPATGAAEPDPAGAGEPATGAAASDPAGAGDPDPAGASEPATGAAASDPAGAGDPDPAGPAGDRSEGDAGGSDADAGGAPAPDADADADASTGGGEGAAGEAGPPSHERARLIALNLALTGSSREELDELLRSEHGVEDPTPILDEVFARTDG